VLIDECLPRRLKREIQQSEVWTVPEAGWAGKKNGELLRLASREFDAFVTIDRSLTFQQDLDSLLQGTRLGVVVLGAPSNRFEALRPLLPQLLGALQSLAPGQVVFVRGTGGETDGHRAGWC
jgi:hypothetical protein